MAQGYEDLAIDIDHEPTYRFNPHIDGVFAQSIAEVLDRPKGAPDPRH